MTLVNQNQIGIGGGVFAKLFESLEVLQLSIGWKGGCQPLNLVVHSCDRRDPESRL